ncbi:transposable element Tcb1 transposase [Trichonephila clavipes]|nr:transposable element Tcb1 transposase [Trichonephila clavipes]
MFSDESRFSLQSDSHRTLIWRAPGIRYHQENTIQRHRYGGAGWLARVWGLIDCLNINVALYSYTRAFGDRPRNFEPWSSDVDDT